MIKREECLKKPHVAKRMSAGEKEEMEKNESRDLIQLGGRHWKR